MWLLIFLSLHLIIAVKRGPPINPQKQKRGDIAQLRGSSGNGTMRNALPKNSRLKWDYIKDHDGKFVIPYVITGFYEKREKKIISEAMGKIDKNTCLRFKLRSHQKDYIEIQNKEGEGCYSTVGRYGGKSVVMLEASRIGSCIQPEVVIHELLHVIGLWHEHMREDRDKYIKVHYENIQKGYENQFAKVLSPDAVTYGVPYDYLSIMHYEKTAFANPRTLSMEPLNPKYLNIIGKQKEPSKNDYLKVCFIYSCDVCMGKKVHLTTTTTRATAKPRPPNPGCDDKDLFKCYELEVTGKLNCRNTYEKDLCCGTCNALSEYEYDESTTGSIHPLYPTPPPGWTTSPSYNHCDDKDPKKCKDLQEANELNCVDNMKDVALCCGTCNNHLDYLEHIRYFS